MEDVQGLDSNLRLENTLAVIESRLVGESDRANLISCQYGSVGNAEVSYREASHEVDRVGDINKGRVKIDG